MSRRKFILLSILKTWLISTVVSVILLILFLKTAGEVRESPGRCDMSGLAYENDMPGWGKMASGYL